MKRISALLASVIVILVGLVTLIALLAGDVNTLGETQSSTEFLGTLVAQTGNFFIRLTVATIGMTILLGIINLIAVHLRRIRRDSENTTGRGYSLVVILAFFVTLVMHIIGQTEVTAFLLENVQIPIESALAGLLFVSLVYAAFRLMRQRATLSYVLFVAALLIVLLGALPLQPFGIFADISDWLLRLPVSAGARGILLGIALATIVTGIRVIIGLDRSYRE